MGLHQLAKEILKSQKYYSISEFTVASLSKHLEVCGIQNLDDVKPIPHILYRLNTDLLIKYSTTYKTFEDSSFNSIVPVKFPNTSLRDLQRSEIGIISQEQADQFLETLERLLREYHIDPDGLSSFYNTTHLDNLLALSYIFQDIDYKYKKEEERQRTRNQRGELLISLLKLPFRKLLKDDVVWLERKLKDFGKDEVGFKTTELIEHGVTEKDVRKHSPDKPLFLNLAGKELEFSTDIKITINSNDGAHEIVVDQAFNKSILEILVKKVIGEIEVSDTCFYEKLCSWDGDIDTLLYSSNDPIKDLFTRKITECSLLISDYLSEHNLLRSAKAKSISLAQSSFLFKYFALFKVLEKHVDHDEKLKKAQETNRRKKIYNPFQDYIDAQMRSYRRPLAYIKETIKDNRYKIRQ